MSDPLANVKRLTALLRSKMAPQKIVERVTQSGYEYLRDYYQNLAQTWKNKIGGKSYYWNSVVKSAGMRVNGSRGEFGISRVGVNLLYYGGTVTPGKSMANPGGKPTKRLAMPARAEAYGRIPGSIGGLKIKWVQNPETGYMQMALVSGDGGATNRTGKAVMLKGKKIAKRGKNKGKEVDTTIADAGGTVYFWLIRSAVIKPHPTARPTKKAVFDHLSEAQRNYIASVRNEAMALRGAQ
jgi:hypothetical protein